MAPAKKQEMTLISSWKRIESPSRPECVEKININSDRKPRPRKGSVAVPASEMLCDTKSLPQPLFAMSCAIPGAQGYRSHGCLRKSTPAAVGVTSLALHAFPGHNQF